MTDTINFPGSIDVAFDHLAAYGAAAIAQAAPRDRVRLAWSDDREPRLSLSGVTWEQLAEAVHSHAVGHSQEASWIHADHPILPQWKLKPDPQQKVVVSALISPRDTPMGPIGIRAWYDAREAVLGDDPAALDPLDYDMIGALGAPSYWSSESDQPRPDHGASRWEMKTRNGGQEFVGDMVRKLAHTVAERSIDDVELGLRGDATVDEIGANKATSRTPTGLKPPEATDNARAWCALWGLSLMRVTHRPKGASVTSSHFGWEGAGHFALPVTVVPWPLARLRTVLRSTHLLRVAGAGLDQQERPRGLRITPADRLASWDWLEARGVPAVVRFPVHRTDNPNAPEKWLNRGDVLTREAGA
jgi:CRISPR-associated protein Csb3